MSSGRKFREVETECTEINDGINSQRAMSFLSSYPTEVKKSGG